MAILIITDDPNQDEFISLEVSDSIFNQVFERLSDLFAKELGKADFLKFQGVAQGLDIIDLTNLSDEVFQKSFEKLKDISITLNQIIQADPRYTSKP